MPSAHNAVNKQAVASAFSRAASSYDGAAVLQREVGERLLGAASAIRRGRCWTPAAAPATSAAAGGNWAKR
ncbi:hypothetical protein GGER_13860 [Serratia rubidaea]